LVTVHYELYQGVPLVSKWLSLETNSLVGDDGVQAQVSVIEKLCTNWQWSQQGKYFPLSLFKNLIKKMFSVMPKVIMILKNHWCNI